MNLDRYSKALVATLIAALGALQTAFLDEHISGNEWIIIAISAVTALGLVWSVPNALDERDFAAFQVRRYGMGRRDEA